MAAICFSLIGVIRGKWWYGTIIAESINLHYVKFLKKELLAEEYYFTNSNWFYKPLWTYEVEKSKKIINQLYYSTNNENIESFTSSRRPESDESLTFYNIL